MSSSHTSRQRVAAVVAALATTVVLAGCTAAAAGLRPTTSVTSSAASSSAAAPPPATVTVQPAAGDGAADPATPVTVTTTDGTLASVALTATDGTAVPGTIDPTGHSWTSTAPLTYGTTYGVVASARNAEGVAAPTTSSFSTVKPGNLTMPYLRTTGGGELENGATYGVGIVPVVHFDEHVTDEAAAERALTVTTTPALPGSWYWADDQDAHYRPTVADGSYWPTGTQVTVSANLFGVQVGKGLYGQANASTSFTIGAKHVSVADDDTHQVSVYFDGVLQRTMPTSMGKGGYATGSHGEHISFYTPSGTYTVIGMAKSVTMDSSTYGLPVDAPGGYREDIPWATRISTDGIYLHELDSTVHAQGRYDTSHGCLNLNQDNAIWFQQNAQIGDVVTVEHTGGAPLAVWQNGDWTLTAAQWAAGSALA